MPIEYDDTQGNQEMVEGEGFINRLEEERDQLAVRLSKLTTFLRSDFFEGLSPQSKHLLVDKKEVMTDYLRIVQTQHEMSL